MRRAVTVVMAIAALALLVLTGVSVVGWVVNSGNVLRDIYLLGAVALLVGAMVVALVARGVWRDHGWAWINVGLLGTGVAFVAWQINQAFYGDGALVSLTPTTPFLAPFALIGLLLAGAAARRLFRASGPTAEPGGGGG